MGKMHRCTGHLSEHRSALALENLFTRHSLQAVIQETQLGAISQ